MRTATTRRTHEAPDSVGDWAAIGAAVRRATREAVICDLVVKEIDDPVVTRDVDRDTVCDRSAPWMPRLVGADATR